MHSVLRFGLGFALLSLGACGSTLEVRKVSPGPQSGIVYALPMTQFEISVPWRVTQCEREDEKKIKKAKKAGINVATKPSVKKGINVATKPSVKKMNVEDPDAIFNIDSNSLYKFFHSAKTEFEFFEGTRMLKSVNVEVEDKAGSFISSVIKSIGSVIVSPFTDPDGKEFVQTSQCTDAVAKNVKKAQMQQEKVKKLTSSIADKKLEFLEAVSAQAEILPGRTEDADGKVVRAARILKTEIGIMEIAKAKLEAYLKPITYTQTVRWPETGSDIHLPYTITIPDDQLKKWFENAAGIDKSKLDISVLLESGSNSDENGSNSEQNITSKMGLYYRSPAYGTLIMEMGDKADKEEIFREKYTVTQLGYINSFVIESKMFSTMKFSAEFDMDGRLKKTGYTETGAPSESVGSIIDALSAQYVALDTAKRGSKQAKLDAELKKLQADLDIEEVKEKLSPSANQEATDTINAETDLIKAEIALIEARSMLNERQQE